MNALVYHGPEDLRLERRELPEPGRGEVLVRVEACGICGTDLRIFQGKHRAYADDACRVPGHEIVGTIAAVGEGAPGRDGDRVFIAPNIGCGRCRQCREGRVNLCVRPRALGITRDGGFADHLLVPADAVAQGNLLAAPRSLDAAALSLVEPLACVVHGQRPLAIGADDVVLIMGAGPIGLMHLAAGKVREPAQIIVSEPAGDRRAQATAWGADLVVDPTSEDLAAIVAERTEDGRGPDVVITAAPAARAQSQAIELAAPAGRVNFFGGLPRDASIVEIDTNLIHYKELLVTGTTANAVEDCREALQLVVDGAIDAQALVSARFGLDEAAAAFAAAASGQALKVVIEP
ncbi:MAG TPA: alcohol dehydrogenase catalytic domain-containing protein [Capillimicrobium sp.]